ncbi:MAG: hypothetical protein J4400_00060 [Candidatus Aenigmarchaeota archaeon]|nr:hypothetical protein [Candidatus Aenigmarchaeota archaeon]
MITDYRTKVLFLLFVLFVIFLGTFGTLITIPVLLLVIVVLSTFATTFYGSGWTPSSRQSIERILKEIRPKKGDIIYDLGSGDGRFVIAAAKQTNAKIIGLEIDFFKWLMSSLAIKIKGLGNAKIIRKNFFTYNFHDADIIFIYLPQPTVDRLQERLKKLRKGTLIVTNKIKCKSLKLTKELKPEKIYIYSTK